MAPTTPSGAATLRNTAGEATGPIGLPFPYGTPWGRVVSKKWMCVSMMGIGAACAKPRGAAIAAAAVRKARRPTSRDPAEVLYGCMSSLPGQRKRKDITAGCNRYILPAVYHVSHRRGLPLLAGFDVPQIFSGLGVERGEAAARLSVEKQISRSRENARVVEFRRADLWNLPNDLPGFDVESPQIFFRRISRIAIRHIQTPALTIDVAVLHRHHIKEPCRVIECRGRPVGRAAHCRACFVPNLCGVVTMDELGPAIRADSACPGQFLDERLA